ncbi:MAG: hypothetical protein JWP87_3401, partial [Labilithrix sp.]|nr:hypothetical protein [Labilithrix sp.]
MSEAEKNAKARRYFVVGAAIVIAGCGGNPAREAGTAARAEGGGGAKEPAAARVSEKPLPFEAVATPLDVVAPWVRPERSSRLAMARPSGKAREQWSLPLDPKLDPAFVVTAGTRIVVQGRAKPDREHAGFVHAPFVLLDTNGRKIASDDLGGEV